MTQQILAVGLVIGIPLVAVLLDLWLSRRGKRRHAAEESERILAGGTHMEERLLLDPSTKAIIRKQVPVGSPMLTG